ncbi:MAG: tyrosine recombinase XerC [Oscillospiraceae bacterium]|nr:tyrosine recombinase XerC [Oscillospiraceae bacterium]
MLNYRTEAPSLVREFLNFYETQNYSINTINEYYLDLRVFFRFMKIQKQMVDSEIPFDEIPIRDIDLAFIQSITRLDIYDYLDYMRRDREWDEKGDIGLAASSLSRKLATLRSFFKFLVIDKEVLTVNPTDGVPTPRLKKSLPHYLTLEECYRLLASVDGRHAERDYCILVLFLNCGMRVSELVGINLSDIQGEVLRLRGKGNKERIVYLNDACIRAINDYLVVRNAKNVAPRDKNALFLSQKASRMSVDAVQDMLNKYLLKAGLDPKLYSPHKLRHTAATLMLQNGVDIRTLQEVLGHANLSTTQIYTHIDNEGLRVAAQANPLGKLKERQE